MTHLRGTSGSTVITSDVTARETYAQSGNDITFTSDEGDIYSMTLSGRTLTQQVEEGLTLVRRSSG